MYHVKPKTYLTEGQLKKHLHFFYNYNDDPNLHVIKKSGKNIKLVKIDKDKFNIVDTYDGAILYEDDMIAPIFILVPRAEIICRDVNSYRDVEALEAILDKYNVKVPRSSKRQGFSPKYASFGTHCNRSSSGLNNKVASLVESKYENQLKCMINRGAELAKKYFPFGLLSTLEESKQFCGDDDFYARIPKNHSLYSTIWSSVATTFNYVAPAHTDEDAFLSALLVSYVTKDNIDNKFVKYDYCMEVANYFCFPESGVAVALRPGDVLFFNPLHYHCASQRLETYANEKIFLTALYLKNKQITRNDNKIPISEQCKLLCNIPI